MLILEGKVSFQIKTLGKTLRGIPTNSTSGFYLYICFYLYISIYRSIAQSQHNWVFFMVILRLNKASYISHFLNNLKCKKSSEELNSVILFLKLH